jgi:ABC-type Na+ efflux pump permease subunit
MSYLIAALGVRLVLAGLIYVGTTAIWVNNARGWEGLGVFAMSIFFGGFAMAALIAAMVIGRNIPNRLLRLVAHPPIAVLLFLLLGYVIAGSFRGMQTDIVKDIRPFLGLVAVIALIDALVGYPLDGWVARKQGAP